MIANFQMPDNPMPIPPRDPRDHAVECHGPVLSIEDTRQAAVKRIRDQELNRQEDIIRAFELEKLQAIFAIRALIEQYGVTRVESWVANQAKELGL